MGMIVRDVCDRCGKSVEIDLSDDQIDARVKEIKAIDNLTKQIKEIAGQMSDPLPEIIVMLRKDTGTFEVRAFNNLCGPQDGVKRKAKGCQARIRELVAEMFPTKKD